MAVAGRSGPLRLRFQEPGRGLGIQLGERSQCPREGLLHVGLFVADQLTCESEASLDDDRALAAWDTADVRDRCQRGADQTALPA